MPGTGRIRGVSDTPPRDLPSGWRGHSLPSPVGPVPQRDARAIRLSLSSDDAVSRAVPGLTKWRHRQSHLKATKSHEYEARARGFCVAVGAECRHRVRSPCSTSRTRVFYCRAAIVDQCGQHCYRWRVTSTASAALLRDLREVRGTSLRATMNRLAVSRRGRDGLSDDCARCDDGRCRDRIGRRVNAEGFYRSFRPARAFVRG